MDRWTDDDWRRATDAARQVVVAGVLSWALFRGLGWLLAWKLCGCTP